jgi:hypothetical protein
LVRWPLSNASITPGAAGLVAEIRPYDGICASGFILYSGKNTNVNKPVISAVDAVFFRIKDKLVESCRGNVTLRKLFGRPIQDASKFELKLDKLPFEIFG